jgi:hypothetical protein
MEEEKKGKKHSPPRGIPFIWWEILGPQFSTAEAVPKAVPYRAPCPIPGVDGKGRLGAFPYPRRRFTARQYTDCLNDRLIGDQLSQIILD